jgi:hypothetical protein
MNQTEILKKYIVSYLQKGYRIEQIQPFLIQNGWSKDIVNQAISEIYPKNHQTYSPPNTSNKLNLPIIPLLTILFFIIIILSSIFFLIGYIKDEPTQLENKLVYNDEQLLDAKVFILNKKITLNQELQFNLKFLHMGTSSSKYDIFIKYEILDLKSNQIIDKWQETRAILNKLEFTERRKITDKFTSKDYKLLITAT